MSEPATEAQYSYLQNLAETKIDIDPETAKAIQEALDSKNLTKSQAGGFIGKLRDLGNKENVGRFGKPSQKMIDSVNRDVYMKGLSDEDRAELLNNLESQSKGDVSAIISQLKDLPDVDGGMEKYIDSLVAKNDSEGLQRILADERYGRWSSQMKDGLAKLGVEPAGLDQRAGEPSYDFQGDVEGLRDLFDRINAADENGDLSGYFYLNQDSLKGIDNAWEAYNLLNEMEAFNRNVRYETPAGESIRNEVKKAAEDLKKSLDSKLGPLEAAKRNPDDSYETFELDKAIDNLEEFFDYYYPTRASEDMRSGDGGMVGDNRGGGWEAYVRFNEETEKWDAIMTSPGRGDEEYMEEFEEQSDAADWIDIELENQNNAAMDTATKVLSEKGIEGLATEFGGGEPFYVTADRIDSIADWLMSTGRGQAETIARQLGEYAERLRDLSADLPGEPPKA
jgi:hypothetical protein